MLRLAALKGLFSQVISEPVSYVNAPLFAEQRGVGLSSADEGTFGMTSGRVGRDVRGVTIVTGGTEVEATVANGWFSAWWPAA